MFCCSNFQHNIIVITQGLIFALLLTTSNNHGMVRSCNFQFEAIHVKIYDVYHIMYDTLRLVTVWKLELEDSLNSCTMYMAWI